MVTVHHLENSRSQRILWLLEELGVTYAIERYGRDKQTSLAPPELLEIHPLGKSPVITDGDITVAESGAIIDTTGRFARATGLQLLAALRRGHVCSTHARIVNHGAHRNFTDAFHRAADCEAYLA
jgi:glutathione S-transferase